MTRPGTREGELRFGPVAVDDAIDVMGHGGRLEDVPERPIPRSRLD